MGVASTALKKAPPPPAVATICDVSKKKKKKVRQNVRGVHSSHKDDSVHADFMTTPRATTQEGRGGFYPIFHATGGRDTAFAQIFASKKAFSRLFAGEKGFSRLFEGFLSTSRRHKKACLDCYKFFLATSRRQERLSLDFLPEKIIILSTFRKNISLNFFPGKKTLLEFLP